MNQKHLVDKKLSFMLFSYIWMMYAVVYMTKNCFGAAMSAIVYEGIMTKSQTGFIMAVFYLVYALFQPLGGKMADRYNPEKLLIVGLLGSAFSNLIIYFNQNYYVILIAWAFNAAIQFGVYPSIFKIITSQLEPTHRKTEIFLITVASYFGLFLAYWAAMFVEEWQHNFLLSAVLLLLFAIGLCFMIPYFEKRMISYEAKERNELVESKEAFVAKNRVDRDKENVLIKSGYYAMLPVFFLYMVVVDSVKTLSATMLMESYETVSPFIGNFMNLFIILAAIVGMFVTQYLVHSGRIKDELRGLGRFLVIALPFLFVLLWIGKIRILVILVSLAVISMLSSAMTLLRTYTCMRFAEYGKEAEAAGLGTAAASLGIVIQSYGITLVADEFGWNGVTWLWLVLIVIAIFMVSIARYRWVRFLKKR